MRIAQQEIQNYLHCLSFISLISAPASNADQSLRRFAAAIIEIVHIPANAFSDPVSTIAPTESSLSAVSNAEFNSLNSPSHRALRALGLFKVTKTTEGSGRETMMCWYD